MKKLNDYATESHEANKTWWKDIKTGESLNRNKGELLMLIVSEIGEAYDSYIKSSMDDKLPDRAGFEVELADAVIRLFDFAGGFGLDLDSITESYVGPADGAINFEDMFVFGGSLNLSCTPKYQTSLEAVRCLAADLQCNAMMGTISCLSKALEADRKNTGKLSLHIRNSILSILGTGFLFSLDLEGAYNEKMEYNRNRADHKPENRLKDGGKKY